MKINLAYLQKVKLINDHVQKFPDTEAGATQLLVTIYDYMEAFQFVMNNTTSEEMDYLCQNYDGFYRFAKLLELMAQGISSGAIQVPKDH